MTLCGVLKDILLVAASMLIWGTPVSGLQFFGYSIALGGMVYYKLGGDSIKGVVSEGGRRWAEYGAVRPAQRKMVILGAVLFTLFLALGALAPSESYGTVAEQGKTWFSSILGKSGSQATRSS